MSFKFFYNLLLIALVTTSCSTKEAKISNVEHYNSYLDIADNTLLNQTLQDHNFWEKKLEKDSNQFPWRKVRSHSKNAI